MDKSQGWFRTATLIALAVVGAACASKTGTASTSTTVAPAGGAATTKAPPTTKAPATTVAPKSSTYSIGQTAKTGGFNITVYAVKDPQPPGDQFSTPQTGDHFISVDVQVNNPGKDQQTFSSLAGFHLLDSANRQYDEDLGGAGVTPGPPEGQIAGGQSIRGFVVFQVPDTTPKTGLTFKAQGSFTAAGAIWKLS
jgi:hypothetical protein